jgi:hypothetical protein
MELQKINTVLANKDKNLSIKDMAEYLDELKKATEYLPLVSSRKEKLI